MSEHVHEGVVTVAGVVGSLITALDRMLCLAECWAETSGPTFTDRSAEARLEGGTAFTILAAIGDVAYFGMDVKFTELRHDVATAAVLGSAVFVWEYWNGSAWTALTVTGSPTTAKNFLVDGEVSWTAPGDWAKNIVNAGPNLYHVRVRCTVAGPTTAPTINFIVHNWTIFDGIAGTNAKVYKSPGEGGTDTLLLWIDDNGTITDAKNAGARLYEAWDADLHTGTAPTPTVAQLANGAAIRKSVTLDATARTVWAGISRDQIILTILSGDTANQAVGGYLGKITSRVAGDGFGQAVCANADGTTLNRLGELASAANIAVAGHYLQRAYTGSGGAVAASKVTPIGSLNSNNWLTYPNGPDGGLVTAPVLLYEGSTHVRGEWTGADMILHTASATLAIGDFYQRSGSRFTVIRIRGETTGLAWLGLRGAA